MSSPISFSLYRVRQLVTRAARQQLSDSELSYIFAHRAFFPEIAKLTEELVKRYGGEYGLWLARSASHRAFEVVEHEFLKWLRAERPDAADQLDRIIARRQLEAAMDRRAAKNTRTSGATKKRRSK